MKMTVRPAVVLGGFVLTIMLAGCGSSSQRATVDQAPRPVPQPTERPTVTPPPPTDTEQPAAMPVEALDEAAPEAREYAAGVRIGARVVDIRTEPGIIRVQVGDSVSMDSVALVPVDANGRRVSGVRILTNLDSRHAIMGAGFLRGLSEGEAELQLAIRVPPPAGTGAPIIRTFTAPVRVVGKPVATMAVVEPDVLVLAGGVLRLTAEARTADDDVRSGAEVSWDVNNREVARIDQRGFLTALQPGVVTVTATSEGVSGSLDLEVVSSPVDRIEVSATAQVARTGDVVRISATALDANGEIIDRAPVDFAVSGFAERTSLGASIYDDGAFVAEQPGLYRVTATSGSGSGQILLEITERGMEHEIIVMGKGLVADRPTSDLWAFTGIDGRDYVYTGTHAGGQRMLAWDITDPSNPILTDYVEVDARVVNDVKVNEDASFAVITREGASDRRNGIVILDLTDPAHPMIRSEYTETLTGGVHNVFITGDLIYAIHNGTLDVHILDMSDPGDVKEVGRWGNDVPGRYLHDVWVVDGLAYLSYWNDGVYILDVGDGRWGGTATEPVEVSSYAYPEGNTHVAFPYTNSEGHSYLFVGDEIFGCEDCISRNGHPGDGSRGFVHILDMADPENLIEVARYEVPEAGAHNLWIEDDKMYVAYYQAGLRVVDVSGELRGDLFRQGRELAWLPTGTPDGAVVNAPMAWGPQPFKGNVYVSDLNSGLWVVKVQPKNKERPVS